MRWPKIDPALYKTITWRVLASTDTLLLSFIIITLNAGENVGLIAGYIAGAEIISKMILYYIHEKVWERIKRR